MKKFLLFLLVIALGISGCTQVPPTVPSTEATVPSSEATVPSTEATVPTTEATIPSTEPPTEPSTEPPTEPAPVFVNPLNGQLLDSPWTLRPFGIMFNNISKAMPQVGISGADIHYEILAEGGITRCFLLFSDISQVETVGSIRSARTYYVELAHVYDCIYVHAGGSKSGEALIQELGVDNISSLTSYSSYFYRDQKRLETMALEHTLMAKSSRLLEALEKKGYPKTRDEGLDYGLLFSSDAAPQGESGQKVEVRFGKGGKLTSFQYDEGSRLYMASQYGSKYIDGGTGEQIGFTNLLAIFCQTETVDSELGLLDIRLTGSGEGYFACGGQIVPILWSRSQGNFSYTLTDGTPLLLGQGRTYIAVLPQNGTVEYE